MTFAFIDESGNTGANMFDPGQPMFFFAALVTQTDVDEDWADRLKCLARTLGHSDLHASVVSPAEVGFVSPHILSLLQESVTHVVLTGVHKKTHVAMKIFDYVFDPGENPGASWHHYWMKPLRVMNALLFADILSDTDLRDGWRALRKL